MRARVRAWALFVWGWFAWKFWGRMDFGSLCGEYVFAYNRHSPYALAVRFGNRDDQWHCYCRSMRIIEIIGGHWVRFECDGRYFERPCEKIPGGPIEALRWCWGKSDELSKASDPVV